MSLFNELKRRNVFRVGIAYVVGAWLVLQLTDVLSALLKLPDFVGPIAVTFVAIGFPVALFFAWAFELTPDGVKRESEIDRQQSTTTTTGKKLNNTIVIMLAVAVAYLLFDKFYAGTTEPAPTAVNDESSPAMEAGKAASPDAAPADARQSIAVLPFENFSGDESDQYFADGLADTLLHKLAQISDLKVIARNSSFQFKGTNKDVREIGKILDVGTVLEGSVQRAGEQVRIIAQLIDTESGEHLWSQSYDDSMSNIFDLQDRIATEIVARLEITLSKEEQRRLLRNGTDNPAAYDLLMRVKNTKSSLDDMVDAKAESWEPLQQTLKVIELDPNYAQAWAELADKYNGLAFASDSADDYDRYVSKGSAAAEEALRLGPNLASSHATMGWVEHRRHESLKAAQYFRHALDINPNSLSALSGLGLQLASTDPAEALIIFNRVQEIDPAASLVYRQKHFALMMLGRVPEAIEQMKLAVKADPERGIFYNDLSDLLIGVEGRPDEAARYVSRLLQLNPKSFEGLNAMVEVWTQAGDDTHAGAWMELLMQDRSDSDSAKLLNARRLLTAARYHESLQQLSETNENDENAWRIISSQLTADLGLGEAAKAAEYAVQFRSVFNNAKARGGVPAAFNVNAIMLEMLSHELSDPGFNAGEMLKNLPALESIPLLQSNYYLLAGVAARLGHQDAAMAWLEQAISKPDGGVFNTDMWGFSVEQSPLLNPLRSQPGFEAWLQRYHQRRDAMHQRMLRMESNGEIIPAENVARMTQP